MPPSATGNSAAMASPPSKDEDTAGAGGFADDTVSELGEALAGIQVGNDGNDIVPGNVIFGIRSGYFVDNLNGVRSSTRGGGWGVVAHAAEYAPGASQGFGQVSQASSRANDNTLRLPSSSNAQESFPEQLPSLLAMKGSALKQQLEASCSAPSTAPSTPPRQGKNIDLFFPRYPSQHLEESGPNRLLNTSHAIASGSASGKGPAPSTSESNHFPPPGFGAASARSTSNSSFSAVGTTACTNPYSSQTSHVFSGMPGHSVFQPGGGRPLDQGGMTIPRNMSANELSTGEGSHHRSWNHVLPTHNPLAPSGRFNINHSRTQSNGHGSFMDQGIPRHHAMPEPSDRAHNQPPAQQVLYMAVQTPDGRQVLQPVQMVQLHGQASAVMMPNPDGQNMLNLNGTQIPGAQIQAQPMMLLPSGQSGVVAHTSGATLENGGIKRHNNKRFEGFNNQGQERGVRQGQNEYGSHINTGSASHDRRAGHHEERLAKGFGVVPPSYPHGDCYIGSRGNTPSSSQRASPCESPTPNDL